MKAHSRYIVRVIFFIVSKVFFLISFSFAFFFNLLHYILFPGYGQPPGYQNNSQMVEENNDQMTENLFGKVKELKSVNTVNSKIY